MENNALWLRKWRIRIADAKDSQAIDVSDLRVVFSVHRAREVDNFSTVKIYNLERETEQWVINNGDRLIIEAGYGDPSGEGNDKQFGRIFDGQIIYPTRSRENNVDYILTLLCVDGNNPLNKSYIAKTVGKGLNQRQLIDAACQNSSVTIPNSSISGNLSPQKLPRGKVMLGNPFDYINEIAANNAATWWVEDGKLNLTKYTDDSMNDLIVTSPATGLIGVPAQTQYGCTWQMLLNPAVKMCSLVQLKYSEMNEMSAKPGGNNAMVMPIDDDWIYQVTEITHVGDTYGNEWYTQCNGVSRYGKSSLMALMANARQNPGGNR